MAEERDIKEVSEMMTGVMELALLLCEQFKDGMQTEDLFAIMLTLQSDKRYKAAFEGLKEIPAEFKDLDVAEVMQLLSLVMVYVTKIVDSMKKKD